MPLIAYIDPESPNAGLTCWLPFPSETAADDDHFAIRGTAQLVIPTDARLIILDSRETMAATCKL